MSQRTCRGSGKSDLISPSNDQASEEILQQILYCFWIKHGAGKSELAFHEIASRGKMTRETI